jgi:hypothetical protein
MMEESPFMKRVSCGLVFPQMCLLSDDRLQEGLM